jgi:predicted phage terminase large subunit-like protein
VLNKNDPISRAKGAIGHLVHHFRALIELPKRMDMWEECQALMLNQDKPAEEAANERGEVLEENQLPSYLFYQAHKSEMDEGAEISWPGVRSLFWLMRQRAKNARAFATEMQGDPRSDEDKVFAPVRFFVSRLSHWVMLGGCDPSMGKGESSHPSALIAGAYDREHGKLHVVDARIKRRLPSKLEADLIEFQREHRCLAIGFENNNAYEHSRQTFITAGMNKSVALPLVGLTETVDREVRIDSLEPYITDAFDPRILFSPELTLLLAELDSWPEKQSSHDYDGLCALYILWKIALLRGVKTQFQSSGRRVAASGNMGGFM